MKRLPQLLCILFFSAISTNSIAQTANSLDTITLQLKWKHQFQFAGYYAAIEQRYYEEAGLYVKVKEAVSGNESIPSVLSNEAQYGVAASDLLISFNTGSPIVILANIFQHSPHVFLTIKNDASDNIHDFSGKSIMLEKHADELIAYLKKEQVDLNDLTFIPHTFSPENLINGEVFGISAYSTDEPFLLKKGGIDFNIYNPRSSGIDFFGDILFTSKNEIKNHPERVKAFLDATIKGWNYALENSDEIVKLIYNKYSQRHSIEHLQFEAEQTERLIMPQVVEVGYINESRWQRIGEIYSELGMLPGDFTLDGFIYDRNPEVKFWLKYRITLFVIFIALLIAFIALRFYKLNKKLRNESVVRIKREEELKAANADKDKLFSIIAHDLKGPIGTIDSFLGLLNADMENCNPETKEIFQQIQESTKSAYKLLENLLKWALSQRNEISFVPQNYNFSDLVLFNINVLTTAAENKNINLINNCDQKLYGIFDKDMISTVLLNLLNNAIKYTSKGGTVVLSAKKEKDQLVVSVQDNGIGMDDETRKNVFGGKLKQVSAIGTLGERGTGLGLVLCKEFINKHHGSIWAESEPAKGSTFYFTISDKA